YQGTEHRTIKYLNNLIEQDHRPVKRRNKFYRSLRTASTTIKGFVRATVKSLFNGEIKIAIGVWFVS
ncbi:DDE-type integrase/transposase/recombinase, partial [Enterococcus faecium]|uniref:DDE-type integrase/transposase/recombinase n=1 Tax=Enterococcus faecium TaxID=1352 RepID=UPI001BDD0A63|nr:DDE-type integrase/transposase/recombinase [Enterococcus faecium]MBT1021697.1 DDE-type integrase/transposase/recombinase [Enterococcus faecium]MBT1036650.1 DDE-type integrase/transposase/recombinase [Enterococcus faecium]MBT1041385.1 DDE-type integrase/transposase/recombinase [Enterococcus faecium]MBT1044347.1 DDE-type integrase/transposase/recombinase [Enterococcus faecium]